MDATWLNITSFLLIFTLAIVSPGPNFIMVANTSLAGSRRVALFSAFGVAVGSGLFALAGMLGLIVLVETLPYFDRVMPVVGGGYLTWLGGRMVLARRAGLARAAAVPLPPVPSLSAFRTGLLTNLTNPKAWAFYISMFTLVMSPQCPAWAKAMLVVLMFFISLFWYVTVALLISSEHIRPLFQRSQPVIQSVLGLTLMVLGVRLLFGL
jgi:threonine/homoserine/homoserine lactone efflux protein